jgi:hypothetical protein
MQHHQLINQEFAILPKLPPHPKIAASWSAYWSGSALCTGKQTGAILFEKETGASSVIMAISLACIRHIQRRDNQLIKFQNYFINVKVSLLTKVTALNCLWRTILLILLVIWASVWYNECTPIHTVEYHIMCTIGSLYVNNFLKITRHWNELENYLPFQALSRQ